MPLFDVYLALDWSARSLPSPARPSPDSLWLAEKSGNHPPQESYWRTRAELASYLTELLHGYMAVGRRVLLGCDFSYAYPEYTAAAWRLTGDAPPWQLIWAELARLIEDKPGNANNRFAVAAELNARTGGRQPGPLWGCPLSARCPTLAPTSPAYPYLTGDGLALQRLRLVEHRLPGTQPGWKLLGVGSVGGQALLGIPFLYKLRNDPLLAAYSHVWPFETGFTTDPAPLVGPCIVHAELWPGIVPGPLDPTAAVRDQAQVRAVVNWLAAHDADGTLGALFATPPGLNAKQLTLCLSAEGWLLGA